MWSTWGASRAWALSPGRSSRGSHSSYVNVRCESQTISSAPDAAIAAANSAVAGSIRRASLTSRRPGSADTGPAGPAELHGPGTRGAIGGDPKQPYRSGGSEPSETGYSPRPSGAARPERRRPALAGQSRVGDGALRRRPGEVRGDTPAALALRRDQPDAQGGSGQPCPRISGPALGRLQFHGDRPVIRRRRRLRGRSGRRAARASRRRSSRGSARGLGRPGRGPARAPRGCRAPAGRTRGASPRVRELRRRWSGRRTRHYEDPGDGPATEPCAASKLGREEQQQDPAMYWYRPGRPGRTGWCSVPSASRTPVASRGWRGRGRAGVEDVQAPSDERDTTPAGGGPSRAASPERRRG